MQIIILLYFSYIFNYNEKYTLMVKKKRIFITNILPCLFLFFAIYELAFINFIRE